MVLALAHAAQAQRSASEHSDDPEAERLVARGIALRAEGKDGQALEAFQQAAAVDPDSVRVQIHLATVHQALGNWLLADDYLSKALERRDHPYVIRHLQALQDAQRVIDANIGRLEVEGQPVGAEVRLNGRVMGTLPLTAPIRTTTGSYVLEVRREGHYPMQRPIVITGGGLVRESVQLEPLPAPQPWRSDGAAASGAPLAEAVDTGAGPVWLTWTLGGTAAAAAAVSVAAWIVREDHAQRWNDNSQCLEPGRTREEVCGDERDAAESAQTLAVVSGVAAGLLAAGAALNGFGVFESEGPPDGVALSGCRVGLTTVGCFGSF